MRWPGHVEPGSTSDSLVSFVDLLPTFIDVAGGSVPFDVDGVSFLPTLNDGSQPHHDYVYGIATKQNIKNGAIFPSRSIRGERYKLVLNFNSKERLDFNTNLNTTSTALDAFISISAKMFGKPFEEFYDLQHDPKVQFLKLKICY